MASTMGVANEIKSAIEVASQVKSVMEVARNWNEICDGIFKWNDFWDDVHLRCKKQPNGIEDGIATEVGVVNEI